jgi:hypothetical protein
MARDRKKRMCADEMAKNSWKNPKKARANKGIS